MWLGCHSAATHQLLLYIAIVSGNLMLFPYFPFLIRTITRNWVFVVNILYPILFSSSLMCALSAPARPHLPYRHNKKKISLQPDTRLHYLEFEPTSSNNNTFDTDKVSDTISDPRICDRLFDQITHTSFFTPCYDRLPCKSWSCNAPLNYNR